MLYYRSTKDSAGRRPMTMKMLRLLATAPLAAYPAGSSCRNRKDPTKKFLHNPACMTEGAWGEATWAFIEKNTHRAEK